MWIPVLCMIVLLLLQANISIDATRNSMELILCNLLPSLFPFFVLTNMLVKSGKIALLSGFLCGYPAGAMACADLYKTGTLSKSEAQRYSMFTSNAGPTFVIGAVGIGMCNSKAIGFLLLAVHFAAAITVAAISFLRFPASKKSYKTITPVQSMPVPFGIQLTEAISSALKQIALVCGYVLFFAVLMGLLQSIGIESPILFSLLEITTGMNCLLSSLGTPASMPALLTILPLIAVLLGFSGFSIHAQIIAILNRAGLPARFFILGKILQAVFSGIYSFLLLQIPPIYNLLANSTLSVFASTDLWFHTSIYDNNLQLLLIEAIAIITIYCTAAKRRLKELVSL